MSDDNWLCSQIIVVNSFVDNYSTTHNVAVIVRNVSASSKAEAIGKFIIGTTDIDAMKKLNVECFPISDLRTIK